MDKSLISECERIAEKTADDFIRCIDDNTHSFQEYRFAYRLALDILEKHLERSVP